MRLTIFIATAFLLVSTSAFPSGAPSFICDTMVPLHGVSPHAGNGGYNVTINGGSSFMPGKANIVKLAGVTAFKGFLIRFSTSATSATATANVGSWGTEMPSNAKVDCVDKSGVTHTDNKPKLSMTFQWMAPEKAETVYFHYTVVQAFPTFYTNQVATASAKTAN